MWTLKTPPLRGCFFVAGKLLEEAVGSPTSHSTVRSRTSFTSRLGLYGAVFFCYNLFVMETKKNFIIFAIIFIFVAGFGGWYIYHDLKGPDLAEVAPPPVGGGATSAINTSPPSNISPEEIKKRMPDLDKEIVVKGDISEETKNTAIKEIKEIIAQLKTDYDRREEWLNLGIWRKTLGDYEGAKEAWEFVTLIRPTDAVAFHNLGDLYSQYLIDFPKAEQYYLTAIAKEPGTPFYYMKLHEFYRYFVKKLDLAENILAQGIKATNGDSALKDMLEAYQEDLKR